MVLSRLVINAPCVPLVLRRSNDSGAKDSEWATKLVANLAELARLRAMLDTRVYECERDCGFLGSFGAVAAHESQPCTDTAARSAPKCSFADAFDFYRVLECNTCHIAVPASAGIWTTSQRSGGRCAACLLCSSDDDSDNDELDRFLAGRG